MAMVLLILHFSYRWAMLRMHMHPEIRRFVSEPYHAVDKFRFFENHKGAWCDAMANPFMLPSLDSVNTEICEQSFKFYLLVSSLSSSQCSCCSIHSGTTRVFYFY
ncbi:hypothetical protein DUNSADRAFT_8962 [Dunaliella salina]|uniref:Encoded protein n=1 Tax=Dunaliella salina TaxID=3046 RepID=A0ABQ7FSK7_DUNSA|nr:hypothetical protein DUNSADRAFT_8962 [Dunaliella salina]|eukprot:KAF5825531.1 hypothetical protein DUNSADRAFT_8962 [Dunaliella salina]